MVVALVKQLVTAIAVEVTVALVNRVLSNGSKRRR